MPPLTSWAELAASSVKVLVIFGANFLLFVS